MMDKGFKTPFDIAIGVLALALIVGGALWFMQKPKQITQPSPTPAAETVDTSNWQTYRNEEFGYTLEIPKDWKVHCLSDEYSKFCMFRSPQNVKDAERYPVSSELPPASLTIFEVVDKSTYLDFAVKREDVRIGENVFNTYEVKGASLNYGLANGDRYYFFYGHDTQILSTFRFIEPVVKPNTSSWKTYRNTLGGFEFKYPSEHSVFTSTDFDPALGKEKLVLATSTSNGISISELPDVQYQFGTEPVLLRITLYEYQDIHATPKSNITFAGYPAYQTRGAGNLGEDYLTMDVFLDTHIIHISEGMHTVLFDQILSSFKFTN